MAERGALVSNENGARVVMFNGSRQEINTENKQLTILYFDQSVLDLDTPTNQGQVRHREPRERSMAELFDLDTTGLNKGSIGKFRVEIHRRLALPWSALGFVLIAVGVLMSGNFTRRGESNRVVMAVLMAGTYQGSLLAVINAAAKNQALIPVIYGVTAIPIVLGLLALLMPGLFMGRVPRSMPPKSGQTA